MRAYGMTAEDLVRLINRRVFVKEQYFAHIKEVRCTEFGIKMLVETKDSVNYIVPMSDVELAPIG